MHKKVNGARVQLKKAVRPKKAEARKPKEQREKWYKVTALFDTHAKVAANVGGEDVVVSGLIPPNNDVVVCLVPPAISSEQGLALQKLLESQFQAPVLVLSNTIQLVRLKAIDDEVAKALMSASASAVVTVTGDADGQ